MSPQQINPNTPSLTIACSTTSPDRRGWTEALALTHTTVTVNGMYLTQKYINPSNAKKNWYRSTSHDSTSTTLHPNNTYICTNFLPKKSSNKWRTYIRLILHTYYIFVLNFMKSKFLTSLSLTLNPECSNNTLHGKLQYTHECIWMFIYVLLKKRVKENIRFNTHQRLSI